MSLSDIVLNVLDCFKGNFFYGLRVVCNIKVLMSFQVTDEYSAL